jgi:sugar-phosphatase
VTVWVVAGPAGSGKTTLGRALAASRRATILDLDTLTNPLLDAIGPHFASDRHWNDPELRPIVREARYTCLLDLARDQVSAGVTEMVLVAPFTSELAGGAPWNQLLRAVAPRVPAVVWLAAREDLLLARLDARGEARDTGLEPRTTAPPVVPHLAVDARQPTADQLRLVSQSASSGC